MSARFAVQTLSGDAGMAGYTIEKMIAELESLANLPAGSVGPLLVPESEDWIYILKGTAIVETVLKASIVRKMFPHIGRPLNLGDLFTIDNFYSNSVREKSLRRHVDNLLMGGKPGVISLAKNLELIDKVDESFILSILEIRNQYAHNILHHKRTILQIIKEKNGEAKIGSILKKMRYGLDVSIENPGVDEIRFGILALFTRITVTISPSEAPPGIFQRIESAIHPKIVSDGA